MTLIIEDVTSLEDAVPLRAKKLAISFHEKLVNENLFDDLFAILNKNQGKCDVVFNLALNENLKVEILSLPLRVQGTKNLEREIISRGGEVYWFLN